MKTILLLLLLLLLNHIQAQIVNVAFPFLGHFKIRQNITIENTPQQKKYLMPINCLL